MTAFPVDSSPIIEPKVSVVVPVYNRAAQLERLLAALSRQTLAKESFEVLVCDDGSSDDVAAVVGRYRHHCGLDVRHLSQPNRGPGAARNLGLAEARAQLLGFTDSDCEPAENWLEEIVAAFESDAVALIGGYIEFRRADHLSGRCVNFLMSSSLGGGGARNPSARMHMKYYPRTCNMAVRTAVARGVGGFPLCWHGDDIAFSHAVLQTGAHLRYVPSLRVLHNERRSLIEVFREASCKGSARVRLARSHGMHELIHMLPGLLCLYVVVASVVVAARPEHAVIAAAPAAGYVLVLAVLAFQAGVSLRSLPAALAVPVYALTMHFGYGVGYWAGWTGLLRQAASGKPGSGR
jgi:glycosyltransferase involved in cell wall biosynthesis